MSELIWRIFLFFAGLGIFSSLADGTFWLGTKAMQRHQAGGIVSLRALNQSLFSSPAKSRKAGKSRQAGVFIHQPGNDNSRFCAWYRDLVSRECPPQTRLVAIWYHLCYNWLWR